MCRRCVHHIGDKLNKPLMSHCVADVNNVVVDVVNGVANVADVSNGVVDAINDVAHVVNFVFWFARLHFL